MASQSVNEQRIVIKCYTLLGKSFSENREDKPTVYRDSGLSNGDEKSVDNKEHTSPKKSRPGLICW